MTSSELQTVTASGDSATWLYRTAMWLLYASLISFYLILRFVWFAGRWPNHQDVQLEIVWATLGTLALAGSSVVIVLAQRAQRFNRVQTARCWLWLTLLLGVSFAIFEASEYRHRWLHNLIPAPFSNGLHDRADLYYLSAVQQRLLQIATAINTSKVRQNQLAEQLQSLPLELRNDRARVQAAWARLQADESQRNERLSVVNRLLISESKWLTSVVATTDDFSLQRLAIAALAYDIHPHGAFALQHQDFRQIESRRLEEAVAKAKHRLLAAETAATASSEPVKSLLRAVAEIKAEQQQLQAQLKLLLKQQLTTEELENELEQSDDPQRVALERQLAEVQQRLDERGASLTAAATLVTEAEDSASQLSQELDNIAARQAVIGEMDRAGRGLNRKYEWLQLPICIPGGTPWAWTYFILTTLHSAHLACMLIVVLATASLPRQWNRHGWSNLERVGRNWHSMVVVWFILFVLIYLT